MIRTFVLSLLAAVLLTAPVGAQDAPAQLFIERIEVRNAKRVSPDVVVSESRLREGREYTEEELRDASARLGRLPFLLSVDFALEKGTERGRHVLVLTIHETKPFFFNIDAQPYFDHSDEFLVADSDRRSPGGHENLALGFRWFVGRRGALHVGMVGTGREREFEREYASLALGYTQYDLFGTRAFATLNVKKPLEGYGEGLLSPQLVVGVPLTANQTLTVEYDESRFARDVIHVGGDRLERHYGQRVASARWSYNTTNEPFFPTRGTLLYVRPAVGWTDGATDFLYTQGESATAYHSRTLGIEAGAARYFELSDRNSVWGDLRAEWARASTRDTVRPEAYDRTSRYGSIGAGFSHSLWTAEERMHGDSRVELTARYASRSRYYYPDVPNTYAEARDVAQIGAAWVRRTSWGTVRLGVGYKW